MRIHIIGDTLGDCVATFNTQFTALAKCRLHIHRNQRLAHRFPISFE